VLPVRAAVPALAGCAVLLTSWLLLTHVGFWKRGQRVDTGFYRMYGTNVLNGEVPYRDFSLEYPPAALPVFVVPALGRPKTAAAYRFRFEWLMALCGVLALVSADAVLRALEVAGRVRLGALLLAGVSPLLLGPVVLTRYDLWPAALSAAALAAFVRDRSRLGGAALGLAAAAKLYPAAVAPVAIAYVWRRQGRAAALRSVAAVAAVFGACVLPFAVIAPQGTWHPLALELHRPLEVESLGGALLLAAHHVLGLKLGLLLTYRSDNLGGTRAAVVAALTTAAEVAALIWVWVACARRRLTGRELVRGAAAAVAVMLALGKVFSPQYLIWLVPLVAAAEPRLRRRALPLLAAACALTQTWYPRHADALLQEFRAPESWLLLVRDLAVVALAVVLVRPLVAGRDQRDR